MSNIQIFIKLRHPRTRHKGMDSKGFTIVELMISLGVLSFILVMSTVIMIQIGSLYNKGVSSSNLQSATRNIMSDITSSIQFGGTGSTVNQCAKPPTASNVANNCSSSGYGSYRNNINTTVLTAAYCIGQERYSYVLNNELGTDSSTGAITPYVLWRDTLTSTDVACVPANMNPPSGQTPTTQDEASGISEPGSGYEMMPDHTRLTNFDVSSSNGLGNDIFDITISGSYGDSDQFDANGNCKTNIRSTSTAFCSTSSINSTVTGRLY